MFCCSLFMEFCFSVEFLGFYFKLRSVKERKKERKKNPYAESLETSNKRPNCQNNINFIYRVAHAKLRYPKKDEVFWRKIFNSLEIWVCFHSLTFTFSSKLCTKRKCSISSSLFQYCARPKNKMIKDQNYEKSTLSFISWNDECAMYRRPFECSNQTRKKKGNSFLYLKVIEHRMNTQNGNFTHTHNVKISHFQKLCIH